MVFVLLQIQISAASKGGQSHPSELLLLTASKAKGRFLSDLRPFCNVNHSCNCIIPLMKLPGFAFLARLVAPLALSSVLLSGAPVALQDDAGERIMNQSCGGCHELRTIQVQALSESEWKDLVNAMVSKGADRKSTRLNSSHT